MPYYVCIVHEKKKDSKRRRKMTVEAGDRERAKFAFNDKCREIDFEPDFMTLREIARKEHDKIVAGLFGNKN
jgi:hypothetical protein